MMTPTIALFPVILVIPRYRFQMPSRMVENCSGLKSGGLYVSEAGKQLISGDAGAADGSKDFVNDVAI